MIKATALAFFSVALALAVGAAPQEDEGVLPTGASYIVQAVDDAGNVGTMDAYGEVRRSCDGPCGGGSVTQGKAAYLPWASASN